METAAKVRPARKKKAASPGPRSPEEELPYPSVSKPQEDLSSVINLVEIRLKLGKLGCKSCMPRLDWHQSTQRFR